MGEHNENASDVQHEECLACNALEDAGSRHPSATLALLDRAGLLNEDAPKGVAAIAQERLVNLRDAINDAIEALSHGIDNPENVQVSRPEWPLAFAMFLRPILESLKEFDPERAGFALEDLENWLHADVVHFASNESHRSKQQEFLRGHAAKLWNQLLIPCGGSQRMCQQLATTAEAAE